MPGKSSLGLGLYKQILCQTASGGVLQCQHIPMLSEPIQRIWSGSRYVPQSVGDKSRIELIGGSPGRRGNRLVHTHINLIKRHMGYSVRADQTSKVILDPLHNLRFSSVWGKLAQPN